MKGWLRNNFNMPVTLSTNEADSGETRHLSGHACVRTHIHASVLKTAIMQHLYGQLVILKRLQCHPPASQRGTMYALSHTSETLFFTCTNTSTLFIIKTQEVENIRWLKSINLSWSWAWAPWPCIWNSLGVETPPVSGREKWIWCSREHSLWAYTEVQATKLAQAQGYSSQQWLTGIHDSEWSCRARIFNKPPLALKVLVWRLWVVVQAFRPSTWLCRNGRDRNRIRNNKRNQETWAQRQRSQEKAIARHIDTAAVLQWWTEKSSVRWNRKVRTVSVFYDTVHELTTVRLDITDHMESLP